LGLIEQLSGLHDSVSDQLESNTTKLRELLAVDSGELSVDKEVISLRKEEDFLMEQVKTLAIQEELLSRIIRYFGKDNRVVIPKVADEYIQQMENAIPYKDKLGLIVQDTFIGMGEEDLPQDFQDWLDDHPDDFINAVMGGYTIGKD